MKGFEKALEMT